MRTTGVQMALKTLLLFVFLCSAPQALACSGACTADADCSANACRYCDTDFEVCSDCCEFTEAITCPSICSWESGECRNISGNSCGVTVPETPRSYRFVFFVGIFLLSLAVFFRKAILSRIRPIR